MCLAFNTSNFQSKTLYLKAGVATVANNLVKTNNLHDCLPNITDLLSFRMPPPRRCGRSWYKKIALFGAQTISPRDIFCVLKGRTSEAQNIISICPSINSQNP